MPIPDWVRKEKNRKYFNAFTTFLFGWCMFGFDNSEGLTLEEYFTFNTPEWTKEDTYYIIRRFIEHGYLKIHDYKDE